MGNRLTKIATRTGDTGTTGLADGSRVPKTSLRIAAMGDVDEINCTVGVLLAENLPDEIQAALKLIQQRLFDLGSDLCYPGRRTFDPDKVAELDALLEQFNASLPPLKEFILPSGTRAGAICHLARAVARRCERSIFRLTEQEDVGPAIPQWINRLSDLLFVISRVINRTAGRPERLWHSPRLARMKARPETAK
jgi:cob(I)alamin adenosyltransferase